MQKTKLVIPLEEIQDLDAGIVGTKAMNLARMNRMGL